MAHPRLARARTAGLGALAIGWVAACASLSGLSGSEPDASKPEVGTVESGAPRVDAPRRDVGTKRREAASDDAPEDSGGDDAGDDGGGDDASDGGGDEGGDDASYVDAGIRCMAGHNASLQGSKYCQSSVDECCFGEDGGNALSCVPSGNCTTGTDIFCDQPAQCGAGGACVLCEQESNLGGTACNLDDIDGCEGGTVMQLCAPDAGCTVGACKPLVGLQGFPDGWFHVCLDGG